MADDNATQSPSAEGRRLIDDRVKAARETRNHLGLGSEVNHLGAKRREEDTDAALAAYVAGLEAEVARLREWSHLQSQDIITLGHMAGRTEDAAALAQLGADP